MSIRAKDILAQFDVAAAQFNFPILDNGYIYHADARINMYRDAEDWLIIVEVLGACSPRTSGCDSFQNCLHVFGSALDRSPGMANADVLYPIESLAEDPLFADEFDWYLKPGANSLGIRGNRVALDVSAPALAAKGIDLVDPPEIDPAAVLRSLLPEHRELLLASDEELAARNPKRLPLWVRLDEWFHPDLARGELPSQNETFQMLAEALEAGDVNFYRPTLPPNTHWKNWPEGGTL